MTYFMGLHPEILKGQMYKIEGHIVKDLLGRRLAETAVIDVNNLPGIVVHTRQGTFYSELYKLPYNAVRRVPVERDEFTETTRGLVELTTKEMAEKGRLRFSVNRSVPED